MLVAVAYSAKSPGPKYCSLTHSTSSCHSCNSRIDHVIVILLLLAMAKELVPSSQGQFFVAAPKGSPPVPRNVCQKATLNRNQSYSSSTKRICNHTVPHNVKVNQKDVLTKRHSFAYHTFIFFPRITSSALYHL